MPAASKVPGALDSILANCQEDYAKQDALGSNSFIPNMGKYPVQFIEFETQQKTKDITNKEGKKVSVEILQFRLDFKHLGEGEKDKITKVYWNNQGFPMVSGDMFFPGLGRLKATAAIMNVGEELESLKEVIELLYELAELEGEHAVTGILNVTKRPGKGKNSEVVYTEYELESVDE